MKIYNEDGKQIGATDERSTDIKVDNENNLSGKIVVKDGKEFEASALNALTSTLNL